MWLRAEEGSEPGARTGLGRGPKGAKVLKERVPGESMGVAAQGTVRRIQLLWCQGA